MWVIDPRKVPGFGLAGAPIGSGFQIYN